MKKSMLRLAGVLVLLCLACGIFSACDTRRNITAEQAIVIMLEDLGDDVKYAADPHVHADTYQDQDCYNVYFSLKGESWVYVISIYGDILDKGPSGGHSH